jgi:hypothetical protein
MNILPINEEIPKKEKVWLIYDHINIRSGNLIIDQGAHSQSSKKYEAAER